MNLVDNCHRYIHYCCEGNDDINSNITKCAKSHSTIGFFFQQIIKIVRNNSSSKLEQVSTHVIKLNTLTL